PLHPNMVLVTLAMLLAVTGPGRLSVDSLGRSGSLLAAGILQVVVGLVALVQTTVMAEGGPMLYLPTAMTLLAGGLAISLAVATTRRMLWLAAAMIASLGAVIAYVPMLGGLAPDGEDEIVRRLTLLAIIGAGLCAAVV